MIMTELSVASADDFTAVGGDYASFLDDEYADPPSPIDWRRVTSIDCDRSWRRLDAWVRWLGARYSVDAREVPRCWYLHGAVVEELTALFGAHMVAFDPRQAASAAADWHRLFWDVRIRLRDWTSRTGCSAREHRASDVPDWTQPMPAYAEELAHHVRHEAAVRQEAELSAAIDGT